MFSSTDISGLRQWLFVLAMIGIVTTSPVLVTGGALCLLIETSETVGDGEDAEVDSLELAALPASGSCLLLLESQEQVLEESVLTRLISSGVSLERGPPAC